jgi:glycine betaine/proline transport system substrate-binding protein
MAALVELEELDHKDAAAKWLADNEDVWTPWTK